jgi:two-component system, response regulator / RNA-binding antiterminator
MTPTERTPLGDSHRLRVLLANERPDRLELVASIVSGLGHEVVAREYNVEDVAAATARERPDVALVGLGEHPDHALELVSEIVSRAFCPVIAYLRAYDGDWIKQAASLGIYAYIVDTGPEELASAIEVTLRRYADFQQLQGAFEREKTRTQAQQRQALALHDGVVQSLTVAGLALDLDRPDDSRAAVRTALENTRTVITDALTELHEQGISLAELLRDTTTERDRQPL